MLGISKRIENLGLALADELLKRAETYLSQTATPNHKTISLVLVEISDVIRKVTGTHGDGE